MPLADVSGLVAERSEAAGEGLGFWRQRQPVAPASQRSGQDPRLECRPGRAAERLHRERVVEHDPGAGELVENRRDRKRLPVHPARIGTLLVRQHDQNVRLTHLPIVDVSVPAQPKQALSATSDRDYAVFGDGPKCSADGRRW